MGGALISNEFPVSISFVALRVGFSKQFIIAFSMRFLGSQSRGLSVSFPISLTLCLSMSVRQLL